MMFRSGYPAAINLFGMVLLSNSPIRAVTILYELVVVCMCLDVEQKCDILLLSKRSEIFLDG